MRILTTDELVTIYQRRKEGLSYNKIGKEIGVSQKGKSKIETIIFYAYRSILKHLASEKPARFSSYRKAVEIIRESENKEKRIYVIPEKTSVQVTTEQIIMIYERSLEVIDHRKVAEELGWIFNGATYYVWQVEKNIKLYLVDSLFYDLKHKKKEYMEARNILLEKYPELKGISGYLTLQHEKEGDVITLQNVWIESSDDVYQPSKRETLNESFKQLKKAIKEYIQDEVDNREKDKPEKTIMSFDISKLTEIDDEGFKGYYFEDIEKNMSRSDFLTFRKWYKGKSGGMLEGKYYVLKEDLLDFIQHES